jgi:hypothetical protein
MLLVMLLFAAPLLWLASPVLVYVVPAVLLGLVLRSMAGRIQAPR